MNSILYTNKKHLRLLTLGLINFRPWKIISVENGEKYSLDLKKRYPSRDLLPFAMRTDCDDVACWDLSREEGTVYIIHDFASIGWEQKGSLMVLMLGFMKW